jgi:serine/threonine protein kinase
MRFRELAERDGMVHHSSGPWCKRTIFHILRNITAPSGGALAMSPAKNIPDPFVGQVVDGRYTIGVLLGRGGMGTVYRAWQSALDREVALKVLVRSDKGSRLKEVRDRFSLEAATSAKLKHPNTITVFDFGTDTVLGQTLYFISMELLEGRPLSRVLGRGGRFSVDRALGITAQIARSLQEAHSKGVVHRDLKPGNIMLVHHGSESARGDDFVKVLDFGLAKTFGGAAGQQLTRTGTFLGSPRYVAPEQINGQVTDGRTDIYALGCVLYRMLVGQVPFDGQSPAEVLQRHLDDPVPDMSREPWPDALKDLIGATLAKEPSQRPKSMTEVIALVKQISETMDPSPTTPSLDAPAKTGIREMEQRKVRRDKPEVLKLKEESQPASAPVNEQPAWESYRPLLESEPGLVSGQIPKPSLPVKRGSFFYLITLFIFAFGIWGAFQLIGNPLDHWLPTHRAEAGSVAQGDDLEDVRLRVSSLPPSSVFEVKSVEDTQGELLGISPVEFTWRMRKDVPRFLRFVRPGYGTAHATVLPPDATASNPTVVEIEAILQREK